MNENYAIELDAETKMSKYYDGEKLRSAIMYMEQFYSLSKNKAIDPNDSLRAYKMFEHYRRLAMCILMKEFRDDFSIEDAVIDVNFMKNLYRKYAE